MAESTEIDTQNIAWARSTFSQAELVDMAANTRDSFSADKGGFGFKMLQKMGWSEGKGLGKNEDGRVKHVKVALRADNVGT